jgi:uncharacterized phage protein (TIGR01671 family)
MNHDWFLAESTHENEIKQGKREGVETMKAKFKVWDSDEKKFVNPDGFMINNKGELVQKFDSCASKGSAYIERAFKKYNPVFSTIKEDKNGVELFEGDIFKAIHQVTGQEIIGKISFIESGWFFDYPRGSLQEWYKCGVKIGNKFENPELMERA